MFIFDSTYALYYTYWFPNIEPPLDHSVNSCYIVELDLQEFYWLLLSKFIKEIGL